MQRVMQYTSNKWIFQDVFIDALIKEDPLFPQTKEFTKVVDYVSMARLMEDQMQQLAKYSVNPSVEIIDGKMMPRQLTKQELDLIKTRDDYLKQARQLYDNTHYDCKDLVMTEEVSNYKKTLLSCYSQTFYKPDIKMTDVPDEAWIMYYHWNKKREFLPPPIIVEWGLSSRNWTVNRVYATSEQEYRELTKDGYNVTYIM